MSEEIIVSNQVECLACGDTPFSMHRHDYQTCKCGTVSVDGGQSYLKRSSKRKDDYKEISIVLSEEDFCRVKDEIEESIDSGRNAFGVACAALRAVRNCGLLLKKEEG